MADQLNKDEEDLLQSALSDAFSPTPVARVSAQPPAATQPETAAAPSPAPAAESATGEVPTSAEDVWRVEYEAHVEEWRARSAEQRAKAEAERAKWEAIRAEEEKAGKRAGNVSEGSGASALAESSTSGWESVRAAGSLESPSTADARDLVAGEAQGHGHTQAPSSTFSSPPASGQEPHSEPESSKHEKWEEVPSDMASSYPSLNYPSDPHSPSSPQRQRLLHREPLHDHHAHHHHHPHRHHEPQKTTATAAIFDSQLSTKTRVLAVLSSLAINMLLPFVNGVMLGFGEIFAKTVVVGWLGWKVPGAGVANVGVRSPARGTAEGRRKTP